MKPKFYDILLASTDEVFETMSFIDVTARPLIEQNTDIDQIEITSIIALGGEIAGMLAIHTSRSFACECASFISGEDAMENMPDQVLIDTIGEISNMIAGTFKRNVSAHVDLFEISLPNVITSTGHTLAFRGAKEDFPRLIIPFAIEDKVCFHLELLYHKR
jgi:chemotaxis protein CheX